MLKAKLRDPRKAPEAMFQYVDVSGVSNQSFRITEASSLKGKDAPSRARKEILSDDVLFATVRPTLKRVALVPKELHGQIASTGYTVLRSDKTKVEPHYLYAHLLTDGFIARMGSLERGAGYPAVRETDVLGAPLPLPPLPEQKRIAQVLSTVQQAIEQQERLIRTTTELKQALMQKLFTEGLRGEAQKETEIGLVPESWEVVPFHEFVTLQRGQDLRKEDFRQGAVPVIGATQVIGYHDEHNVKGPGVVVVRSGSSAGLPQFVEGDFWAHNVLLYVKDFHGNMPKFTYYKILEVDLTRFRQGVAVPTLNRNTFSSELIALPPLTEQKLIASTLDSVESKTQIARRKSAILQDLFRTLLHELMTGKVRVQEPAI